MTPSPNKFEDPAWLTCYVQGQLRNLFPLNEDALLPSPREIRQALEATLKQLHSALARHKVLPIIPEAGSKFDPHVHQAISMVPSEQEPNTVVTVLQKGYQIAERVLRPALVTVAAPR